MKNLPGKTAFVTGGASGIGLGIAISKIPIGNIGPGGTPTFGGSRFSGGSGFGLSDCVMRLLSPFFLKAGILFPRPLDLSKVRLHDGVPSVVKEFAVIDVEAITVNSDIYARDVSRFAGRSWEDIELIAHELTHVQQYSQLRTAAMGSKTVGTVVFGAVYLGGFLGGLITGKGTQQAEKDNPVEKDAESRAAEIVAKLKAQGKQPCK